MVALAEGHLAPARILVLGVTPQIVSLPWPAACRLTAVDADEAMIRNVWQPGLRPDSQVIHASWAALPLPSASVGLAVGDCSFNALASPAAYEPVARSLRRVLDPGGALVVRAFMPPEGFITAADVVRAAHERAFPNARDFRLHLSVSLAREGGTVRLRDVLAEFNRLVPNRQQLADAAGWTREDVDLADVVLGQPLQLTYPTLARFLQWLGPSFALDSVRWGTYACARICPTLKLLPA